MWKSSLNYIASVKVYYILGKNDKNMYLKKL